MASETTDIRVQQVDAGWKWELWGWRGGVWDCLDYGVEETERDAHDVAGRRQESVYGE